MHYHSLFKWLERQSSIKSISTRSAYFTINHKIVRYSDHFSASSKCNVCIVKTDNFYIIYFNGANEYKTPIVRTKLCDVKSFLSPIFYYWKLTFTGGSSVIPEINEFHKKIEEQVEIADKKVKESKESKSVKVPTIHSKPNDVATNTQATTETYINRIRSYVKFNALPKTYREKVITFITAHPSSYYDILEFLDKHANKKNSRDVAFRNLVKRYAGYNYLI